MYFAIINIYAPSGALTNAVVVKEPTKETFESSLEKKLASLASTKVGIIQGEAPEIMYNKLWVPDTPLPTIEKTNGIEL